MEHARPLPEYLVRRYHGWKATTFAENRSWYHRLAEDGQRPRTMVISCCDSRVQVTAIFGAEQGEFFIHRNIANLVPPYAPDTDHHGTSAAVEYAITGLHVSNLVVVGHSGCGGVRACYDMCSGHAPQLDENTSFLGRWMDILRPGFDRLPTGSDDEERISILEKESVVVSLENLMTFPFVEEAVKTDELSLHGLWNDISSGDLLCFDGKTSRFTPI